MAIVASYTNPIGGRPALRNVGAIFVSIDCNGTSYATATGGLPVDLAGILAGASQNGIPVAAVIDITGRSNTGYHAVFTFSTGTTWNMRLYTSGASEVADVANSQIVKAIIWVAGGALP